MVEKAYQKMEKEADAMKMRRDIVYIMEHLREKIHRNPALAEKVLDENKTLKGAYNAMETEARRMKTPCISDEEGFEIIEKYYGFDSAAEAPAASASGGVVDLFDLI